jgi:hypothetical protein
MSENYKVDNNGKEDMINIISAIESLEKVNNPKIQPYIEILRDMMEYTYIKKIVRDGDYIKKI